MRLPTVSSCLALLLLSAVVVVPFAPEVRDDASAYWLEAETSWFTGGAILYFDDGQGIVTDDRVAADVVRESDAARVRFSLQPADYRRFVIHFPDAEEAVTVRALRLLDRGFRSVREFGLSEVRQVAGSEEVSGGGFVAGHPVPDLMDGGVIEVEPSEPVSLQISVARIIGQVTARVPIVAFPGLVFLLLIGRVPSLADRIGGLWHRMRRRPVVAVMIVAGLAVLVSTYPVVFMGKSLASPNFLSGSLRLYDQHPTLPGMSAAVLDDVKGADLTAFGWQHGPYASVQHQAIFGDGELPLWNRYNSGGTVLLAQGQSMFGDPLHFLVIAADGAAWAWDAKFVLARWWFAFGLAVLVWFGTRHLPSALITAVSAPFIGFFVVRVNHPAVFSLCYSPWILVAWFGGCQAVSRRQLLLWLGALVGANWMEVTSGTAKEAWVLLTMFNLTGVILLALQPKPWRWKLGRLAALGSAVGVFVLLSAPLWWTFLDVLPRSHTMYEGRVAYQVNPSLLLGLFDEIFYRPLVAQQRVWNPSANFFTLGGVLLAVVTWRQLPRDACKYALAIVASLALAMAFGVVPPGWITRVPLLGNIGHIDNAFSCPLIVLLIALAGYGFSAAASRLRTREGRGDLVAGGVLFLAVLALPWLAFSRVVHRPAFGAGSVVSLWQWGDHLPIHPYVWASLIVLPVAMIGLGIVVRRRLRMGQWTPATIILMLTGFIVLLWRHGEQAPGMLDMYVVNPPERVDLFAPSSGLEFVRATTVEPTRIAGIGDNLVPGWSAVYGLESLTGCDALMNREVRELAMALDFEYTIDWRLMVPAADLARLRPGGDMFNVANYVARGGAFEISDQTLRRVHSSDLDVYHSDTVWPRAFFVDRVGTYESIEKLAAAVKKAPGRPLAMMAAGELPPAFTPADDLRDRTVVPATDYRLTANETRFHIEAPGPGLVVLHEAWLRGDFVATVNGRPVDYYRVNHGFKGCFLDAAGTYEISFRYRPSVWTPATLLAGLALAILLGGAVALARPLRSRDRD